MKVVYVNAHLLVHKIILFHKLHLMIIDDIEVQSNLY